MKSKLQKCLLATFIIISAVASQATTRKVLFIGDSYTYMNNMPLMLQLLAGSLGDTLIYDQSDPGGYTLELHSSYAPTITKIFSQQWDIVVLQEQSELPAFPQIQVDTQMFPYAHKLDSMIHVNDNCTETMFMMTWGHANGDPLNCQAWPPVCTYLGMQQGIHDTYMQITQQDSAIVAPVGVAWKEMRDSFPAIWLYQADSTHPSINGSYLQTCVLYNSIFHKKTFGASYISTVNSGDASTIQRMADKVVLDSLAQWQQYGHYPSAYFTYTETGNQVTFTEQPSITAQYTWHFGDGNSNTQTDPMHTYASGGTYTVSHTASNACFTETITKTIPVNTTGVGSITENTYPIYAVAGGNGNVTFILPEKQVYNMLDVYDACGRRVKQYSINGMHKLCDTFAPGFYLYRAYSADDRTLYYNKLIVN